MQIITHNDGQRIIETNWYDLHYGDTKTAFSLNAGCLRVLVARNITHDVPDMLAAKVAVLTIGPVAPDRADEILMRLGTLPDQAAHLMFDDSSDTPYCLFSTLNAFDVLPSPADDTRTDLACAIYAAAPDLTPRLCGTLPLRIRHTSIPNFAPAEEVC